MFQPINIFPFIDKIYLFIVDFFIKLCKECHLISGSICLISLDNNFYRNIGLFSYAPHKVIDPSTFAPYSNSCRSYSLLKAIANSKGLLIAIAFFRS